MLWKKLLKKKKKNLWWSLKKCLKIYQLNAIKKIKRGHKKKLVKDIKISSKKKKAWERSERYGSERYKKLSEDEKQKLLEYTKNIEWEKTLYYKYKEVF